MFKQKPSGTALLMYSIIAVTAITAAWCLGIYYLNNNRSDALLWTGTVCIVCKVIS